MRVLLCGFEPFGDRVVNNAWEIAKAFEGSPDIDVLKLPVSFNRAHRFIEGVLKKQHYDFVLMLGETSFTPDYVRLERLAINYKDSSKPDNDGITADDEDLIPGAPKAYFTAFPVKKVAEILKEKEYRIKVTNSTGTFVCNSVYYNILRYLSENNLPQIALFVHLPVSTEIISLNEMKDSISALIEEYTMHRNLS